MGLRIEEHQRGRTKVEIAYADGDSQEPSTQSLRILRERAFAFIFGPARLTLGQHEAVERFVNLKKETNGLGSDILEDIRGAPGRVIIENGGEVHEVYGGSIRYSQLIYPTQVSVRPDEILRKEFPGAVAAVVLTLASV